MSTLLRQLQSTPTAPDGEIGGGEIPNQLVPRPTGQRTGRISVTASVEVEVSSSRAVKCSTLAGGKLKVDLRLTKS